MRAFYKPLAAIEVPSPLPDEEYSSTFSAETFRFRGLKQLLGAADYSKAGEIHAGLCARSEQEREAARACLSQLTLEHFFQRPLTTTSGKTDEVMRANYAIDTTLYHSVKDQTLGQFKDLLLGATPSQVSALGHCLTGVMVAAVAKLCDVHELVFLTRKIERVTQARTTLGLRGRLSSRLQPNHPSDDLRGIELLTYWGLALGGGDALIGLNPAIDTVQNLSRTLQHLDKIRRNTGAPTQICVLGHIKTQLACLAQGAPVEILFQSLAGTERTLTEEFDVTVALLDEAYETMKTRGPLTGAKQFMYFETGQGSEFSYGKHEGIDMTTTEALCYGLARRYDPFMVNNVTGFIGPETHRDSMEMVLANLQDQFMGKLLGLPMGMAPCFTLHSQIQLEGQQIATQLLTAAGSNFYMDVALNTDRMLAYFDTSGHDDQTLREIYGRLPTPEFHAWAVSRGILNEQGERGPNWGNPRQFCASDAHFAELCKATPNLYGFESAGPRPSNSVSRLTRSHRARGVAAVHSELDLPSLTQLLKAETIHSQATNREIHLSSPALGSLLSDNAVERITRTASAEAPDVQILLADGLSAEAVNVQVPLLYEPLVQGILARGYKLGETFLVPFGRVKIAEPIALASRAKLTVLLIGERPGGDAGSSRSLSAYLVFRLHSPEIAQAAAHFSGTALQFEYSVISNIYEGGLPPLEAAAVIAERSWQILEHSAAGNRLESLIKNN